MRIPLATAVLLLLLLVGPASADEVIGMGSATTEDGQVVFTLKYRTSLAKTDDESLRIEADVYWQRAIQDVENSGRYRAIFTAVGHVPGEKEDWTRDFVFARRGPGNWHTLEADDRTKLDEPFLRAFFERYDTDALHRLTDATLLYVAPEWEQKTRSETPDMPATRDFDRASFSQVMHRVNFAASSFKHQREILAISVGEDGKTARVESRQTDGGDVLGKHDEVVSRTTDFLELRGRFVLVTKTERVIEKYTKTAAN